jgi:signal transduction histidine kinase
MALSFIGLYAFVDYSITKARSIQSQLFERDLRDLANHFDADERFVVEHNLPRLTTLARPLSPMLLPRQYYVSLPAGRSRSFPRQPPRNCFVELIDGEKAQPSGVLGADRFCAYFIENPAPGEFVFVNIEINDDVIVPLRRGDLTMAADSLDIVFEFGKVRSNWRIALQSIGQDSQGRYEITAFRKKDDGIIERDRRFEGWAYTKRQADGSQKVHILARLDMHEFIAGSILPLGNNLVWPPDSWDRASFKITRYNYAKDGSPPSVTAYNLVGNSILSIPSLATSIFAAHSTLDVRVGTGDGAALHHIAAPYSKLRKEGEEIFKFVDDDILIRSHPLVSSQGIPDTTLQLVVTHPGMVIESGVWRVFLFQAALALGTILTVIYLFSRLLKPIFVLSSDTRKLVQLGTDGDLLPYVDRKDEIGILAGALNELIRRIRLHVERELLERTERNLQETIRRDEAVRNREENLNIIGHEIRSPLQALISLHSPGSESRRFLDRILGALPHLQHGLAAEDAISARRLDLESIDLSQLMPEIARNAALVDIPDVVYEGETDPVQCLIDVEAFEDVVDNVLRNANRHRESDTPIFITLRRVEAGVSVQVTNKGYPIPPDIIGKIFDYGFSTAPKANGNISGIGLWVAKQYLAKMRGTITAQNIPSGEVAFEIVLQADPTGLVRDLEQK